ncbi:MAG: TMEM175 family protein [Bacteroidota bacterium]|nr:TMEM175 family protein [Bacteroidota bacterium]
MSKERLLAFSDGVFAIIITIMVLELRLPEGNTFAALKILLPKFLSYILSFIYVGIYWNNHHHLFQLVNSVNGKVLWRNLHLLFWLSLVPFATAWMGENHFSSDTVILYGIILLMNSIAYYFLLQALLALQGKNSLLSVSIGNDFKGKISTIIYIAGIGLCFINAWLGIISYSLVALIWFIPDKRIENRIEGENARETN